MYYTSVLGAECIALLCSVSRVASASFSFSIFNDVLVSSTLTLPVNIFTWKKEKPCSPRATKIFVVSPSSKNFHGFSFFQVKMCTGSISVLLTSTSLKIKKKKLQLKKKKFVAGFRWFQVVSGGSLF